MKNHVSARFVPLPIGTQKTTPDTHNGLVPGGQSSKRGEEERTTHDVLHPVIKKRRIKSVTKRG